MSKKVLILLDADVVIHLLKADKISLLNELYPGRLRMLDVVLSELRNNRTINSVIDNLFIFKQVEELTFPTTSNPTLFREYLSTKNQINGDGERACLLYCKHHQHIIASSNTTDIVPFCKEHSLAYLTTLDILSVAVHKNKITRDEANSCIQKVIFKGESYLPHHDINKYINNHFDTNKVQY
jgi:predicted nucleic acid-binding protein